MFVCLLERINPLYATCCGTCICSHQHPQYQGGGCTLTLDPDRTLETSSEGTFAWYKMQTLEFSAATLHPCKSPARLCNDHFGADVVELFPEVTGLEVDPGVGVTGLLSPRVLLHLQLALEGPERLHLWVEVGRHQGGERGHGGAHQALKLHPLCVRGDHWLCGYQGVPALIGPAGADALLTPVPGLVWQVWQVSTRTDTGAVSSARGRHGERQREPRVVSRSHRVTPAPVPGPALGGPGLSSPSPVHQCPDTCHHHYTSTGDTPYTTIQSHCDLGENILVWEVRVRGPLSRGRSIVCSWWREVADRGQANTCLLSGPASDGSHLQTQCTMGKFREGGNIQELSKSYF